MQHVLTGDVLAAACLQELGTGEPSDHFRSSVGRLTSMVESEQYAVQRLPAVSVSGDSGKVFSKVDGIAAPRQRLEEIQRGCLQT